MQSFSVIILISLIVYGVCEVVEAEEGDVLLELLEDESSFNSSMGNISADLIPTPPPTRIPYSLPSINTSYRSKDPFSAKGMQYLYKMTNIFINLVNRDQEVPHELGSVVEREIAKATLDKEQADRVTKELQSNWDVILIHYIGLVCLVVLGLLMAVIMPFSGLIFACCRCGGRCGAEEPCYDKKRDPCKRALLGTLLTLLVVVLLIGIVCPFVTNARLENGVRELPEHARTAIQDTKLFINNTHKEIETLNEHNFKQLKEVLFNKLDRSGELINMELARVSKAIAIDNLTAIAASLTLVKQDLHIIRNATLKLKEETSNLQSGLSDVANRLKTLKDACEDVPECLGLISKYSNKLEISNQFLKLPSVETKLAEVERLIQNEIEIEVKHGKRAFESIALQIQSKVRTSIPEIKQQIRQTGQELRKASRETHKNLRKVQFEKLEGYIDVGEKYIVEYSEYRYWAFYGLSFIMLFITLCFTMGLLYGCCGRRPDEATSCYKTSGASWLMWGVGLTFLFSVVILISTTSLFVIGTTSELLVCDPLRDPTNSEVFDIVAKQIRLDEYYEPGETPKLQEMIRKCHSNDSLVSVLHLKSFDMYMDKLTNYRDHLNLDEKIEQLKQEIGLSIDTEVQIFSPGAKAQLLDLANSSIAHETSWHYYTNILEQKVLKIDLLDLTAKLNQTADDLPPGYASISVKLKNDAIFLEALRRWLYSIEANIRTLKETTARLRETLKFNRTSLGVAIHDLIRQAEFAQVYLRTNGSSEVVELVNRFTDDFLADIDDYVVYVDNKFRNEVGRCGPLSVVYNATTSAVCRNVLYPFNGFWASVGWCFVFFIPCMIVAVELASLYRKTEPYTGPLTESEYLYDAYDERNSRVYLNNESMYDAYAERDNIPLTSGSDKKNRRSRDYDGANVSSYTAEQYQAAAPPARTYPPNNDWTDFPPSGGPPRYTSQPSLSPEYERPPPYYYPGPGNT